MEGCKAAVPCKMCQAACQPDLGMLVCLSVWVIPQVPNSLAMQGLMQSLRMYAARKTAIAGQCEVTLKSHTSG